MKHSKEFEQIVDDARSRVKETNVQEIKTRMDRGDKFHFIDVREDNEWTAGHLPGAKHMGKGVIERDVVKEIPNKSDEIVLYCGGGYRSALAADNLQKMGYTNVKSMNGGFRGWRDAGFKIETK